MRRHLRRVVSVAAVPLVVLGFLVIVIGAADPGGAQQTADVEAHSFCDGGAVLFCFAPDSVTVDIGGTVTWADASRTGHTVTRCIPEACEGVDGGSGTDETFTTGVIDLTHQYAHTFTQPGTYNYWCEIHGYAVMHGVVNVTGPTTTEPPTTEPPTTTPGSTQPSTTPPGSTQTTAAGGTVGGSGTSGGASGTSGTSGGSSTGGSSSAGASSGSGSGSGSIANTGSHSGLLFGLGLAFIATGLVFAASSRQISSTGRRRR